MSKNPILFRWLDINWTLNECLLVSAVFLVLLAAGLFIVLFRHVKGRVQRMSREETWDLLMNAAKARTDIRTSPVLQGPAVGLKAELKCNIDTLRRAARRGDWLTFWLWPIVLSGWSTGFWLLFMAVVPREPFFIVLVTVIPAFIVFVAWFMPWAAIYTNIDLDADAEAPAQAEDRAQPPSR